ncbi:MULTISPECIES: hypothetical protein [Halorhodospira]|uniref:hypothetical protein n=1 Tax=Halorhodospira TaxID=85108 RepID=UPI001EE8B993|nr:MULTISPECIES: hypothetical protein [Halorhodospira]MCG5528880.1 hypothetical protein [Halorhodospira halophila]MCG5544266.1 hypothetical protein [Halorhodospira sp. 9628]
MTQKTDYRWSGAARARRLGRSAARHTLRPVIKRSTREWAAWMGPAWKGEGLLGDEERVVRMPMHRITHYYADVTGAIVRGYLIVGGPWDYLTYPMEDATWLYACRHTRTVYQIFDAGLRPEETSEYRKQVWKLRLGKSGRKKLKTRRALDAYFDDMRRTYHRMREQGYFVGSE